MTRKTISKFKPAGNVSALHGVNKMRDIHSQYYEDGVDWTYRGERLRREMDRILSTMEFIPDGVDTILDAGCGNGIFVNNLPPGKYSRVVGLDRSERALSSVKTEKVAGDISSLPFPDGSFDMVASLEVLEHLSGREYESAVRELLRVSKKYILISVPNGENLSDSSVRCPGCLSLFNSNHHLRRFTESSLSAAFGGCRVVRMGSIGKVKRIRETPLYNSIRIAQRNFRKNSSRVNAACPLCGEKICESSGTAGILPAFFYSMFGLLILFFPARKRRKWIVALFEKGKT